MFMIDIERIVFLKRLRLDFEMAYNSTSPFKFGIKDDTFDELGIIALSLSYHEPVNR